jgi:hypothetical protein
MKDRQEGPFADQLPLVKDHHCPWESYAQKNDLIVMHVLPAPCMDDMFNCGCTSRIRYGIPGIEVLV